MQKSQPIYRVIFTQEDKIYEIYAHYLCEENLMGFIEIEDLIFTEPNTVVVDPSEERLKAEFNGVKRCYIPMHMVLRIDEMAKEGTAKIKGPVQKDNVRHFPGNYQKPITEK